MGFGECHQLFHGYFEPTLGSVWVAPTRFTERYAFPTDDDGGDSCDRQRQWWNWNSGLRLQCVWRQTICLASYGYRRLFRPGSPAHCSKNADPFGEFAFSLRPHFHCRQHCLHTWAFFLFSISAFPVEWALQQAGADQVVGGSALTRISGMGPAAAAIQSWLLVRYGIQGLFEVRHPWRAGLFFLSIVGAMFSGFRSSMVTLLLLLAFQFYFERLLRTRFFPIVLAGAVAGLAIVMITAERLPMALQRTLTFLPIQVDPMVRRDAEGTIEWRVQMWKLLVKEIPEYFWIGKGFAMDPTDMYLAGEAAKRGHLESFEGAKLAGDYHSGPLSLIIPLGILV